MLPPCHFLLYSSNTIGTIRKKLSFSLLPYTKVTLSLTITFVSLVNFQNARKMTSSPSGLAENQGTKNLKTQTYTTKGSIMTYRDKNIA